VTFVRASLFTKEKEVVSLESAPTKTMRTGTNMSAVTPIDYPEAGAREDGEKGDSAGPPSGPVRAKYAVVTAGHEPGKKEAEGEAGDGADGEQEAEAEDPQGLVRLLKTNLALKELLYEMMNVGADNFQVAKQGMPLTAWNEMQPMASKNAALPVARQAATLSGNAATKEQRTRWMPAKLRRTITVWEVKCKALELTTMAVANELYEEELKITQKRRIYRIGFAVLIVMKVILLSIFIVSQTIYDDEEDEEDFFSR